MKQRKTRADPPDHGGPKGRLCRRTLSVLLCLCLGLGCALPARASAVTLHFAEDGLEHTAWVSGFEDGSFRPDETLTRAQGAQLLYGLLEQTCPDRAGFSDVAEDAWYYDAVGLLAAGGVFGPVTETFRPDDPLTRGDFVTMIARLAGVRGGQCSFSDLTGGEACYPYIAAAVNRGWVSGFPDGTFRPDETLTRAQAVTILCRVLGRQVSRTSLDQLILPLFSDVSPDHWAYAAITEAAIDHTCGYNAQGQELWTWMSARRMTGKTGRVLYGTQLYYISPETGLPVTNVTVDGFAFGANGRYTSGDTAIDGYVQTILTQIITDDMTDLEKLRAAYDYVRDSFTYLRRNAYEIGATGWALEEARTMFSTGMGNCYCYAAVFYCLARQLGFDAEIYSGAAGQRTTAHSWVEITLEGRTYLCDPEREMAARSRGTTVYDCCLMPADDTPWPYFKD